VVGDQRSGAGKRQGTLLVTLALGAFLVGCPQLLEDDFTSSVESNGTGGSLGQGGTAGGGGATGGVSASGGSPGGSGGNAGSAGAEAFMACPFAAPVPITGLNLPSGSEEWGPTLSADGMTLIASSVLDGNEDLFQATRLARDSSFSAATSLANLNTDGGEGTPFLSASGITLYFFAIRAEGPGGRDIYFATRPSTSEPFDHPALLGGVNSESKDHMPRLSADERSIVFVSERPGGSGRADLWTATRTNPQEAFGTPVPLASINTTANEESGSLLGGGLTLLFDSNRAGGHGGTDIWVAGRAVMGEAFGEVLNPSALNGPDDELNVIASEDEREVFFSSNRGEASGDHHLWRALRSCP
jgi:hypothetical protein